MCLVETVANVGAIALEHLRAYEIIQEDYEASRRDMLQWRAEMGDEWMREETPKRVERG